MAERIFKNPEIIGKTIANCQAIPDSSSGDINLQIGFTDGSIINFEFSMKSQIKGRFWKDENDEYGKALKL